LNTVKITQRQKNGRVWQATKMIKGRCRKTQNHNLINLRKEVFKKAVIVKVCLLICTDIFPCKSVLNQFDVDSSFQSSSFSDTLITGKTKRYKIVKYYSWGIHTDPKWIPDNHCIKDLKIKYGYESITKGCVFRRGQRRRWIRHNKKTEKIMTKRHGDNWSKKLEFELRNCHKD
jgi:hypothetical protein